MLKYFLLLPILLVAIAPATAQAPSDTIPFRLNEANNILVDGVINDTDSVVLMFHTAASGVGVTTAVAESLASMTWSEGNSVESWGGQSTARASVGNALRIGNSREEDLTIWEGRHSGPGSNAKFGPDFFAGRLIEINYDEQVMIVHGSLPSTASEWEALDLVAENGFLFLPGTCVIGEQNYPHRFLLHSGFGGDLLLDDSFAAEHQLADKLTITSQRELKDSYDNTIVTLQAELPAFLLGSQRLTNLAAEFFEGTVGRQRMSVAGCGLLSRFNFLLDVENSRIYLDPRG